MIEELEMIDGGEERRRLYEREGAKNNNRKDRGTGTMWRKPPFFQSAPRGPTYLWTDAGEAEKKYLREK